LALSLGVCQRDPAWHPRRQAPGRSCQRLPLDVNVGDVVLYSKYGGTEVKYAGEEYLILSARDVLAVVEK
jgi:chaperonin GroES